MKRSVAKKGRAKAVSKGSKPFVPITCWAEVARDGTFTCYDLAPTRGGIVGDKIYMANPPGVRAVQVRITQVRRKRK